MNTPRRPRIFLRPHSPRAFRLKAAITATFFLTLAIEHAFAAPVALTGNLLWLWADFE